MMFRHKGNGKAYELVQNCKVKIPGTLTTKSEWVEGVIYVNEAGMSFCRTKENFNERFEPIEENGIEVERSAYQYMDKHKDVADDLAYKLEDAVEKHKGPGNPFKNIQLTNEERERLIDAGCV